MGQQLRTCIPHAEDLELISQHLQQPPGIPIPRNLMAHKNSYRQTCIHILKRNLKTKQNKNKRLN